VASFIDYPILFLFGCSFRLGLDDSEFLFEGAAICRLDCCLRAFVQQSHTGV
jgi:hypothetical protein